MFAGWSDVKAVSGVAAAFILAVSAVGLFGNISSVGALSLDRSLYIGAVMLSAFVGTMLVIKLPTKVILKTLGFVLVVAGCKLIGVY